MIKHPAVVTYLPSPRGFLGTADFSKEGKLLKEDAEDVIIDGLMEALTGTGERVKWEVIVLKRELVDEMVARADCCNTAGFMSLGQL